jgi:putative phosphoesterase
MLNYLIFSDLHGDQRNLNLLLKRLEEQKVETLICVGDLGIERLGMAASQLKSIAPSFKYVKGNCDVPWNFRKANFNIPPLYLVEQLENRKLFVTHGDLFYSHHLFPLPIDENDIFITGHTHIALLEKEQGSPYLLNPGSLSTPRDKSRPTYALINKEEIVIKELETQKIVKRLNLK